MNEVHAGGVIGGRIDRRVPDTPSFISFARFGMPPSAIHGRMSVHVAASNPMITTFGFFFMSGAEPYRLRRKQSHIDYVVTGCLGIRSFIHAPRLHPGRVKSKINDPCVHCGEALSNYVTFVKRAVEHHVAASACSGDLTAEGARLEGFRVKLVNMRRRNARSHFLFLQPPLVKHVSETVEVSQ